MHIILIANSSAKYMTVKIKFNSMLMISIQYNEYHLGCHGYVLLLCISVVLVDIQHNDGICQGKCCIGICKWLSIRLLQ